MRFGKTATLTVGALLGASALVGFSGGQSHAAAREFAAHKGASSAVTKKTVATRSKIVDGKSHLMDKRKISMTVSQTKDLQGRQEIDVNWTGAHPTGGIVADENAIDAQQEEYPFVILECRGVDSSKVKPADRLSQQTCWTQNWSEHYQDSIQTQFPPYREDRYAPTADRAQVVGAPKKLPTACNYLPAPTQHWLSFDAVNGHVYRGGPAGCAGEPPESQAVGGSALPSNETFGVTGTDGKGSAQFDVWTNVENASLGCSNTVKCSLVAVPIEGISCDVAGASLPASDQPSAAEAKKAAKLCQAKGAFTPGQLVHPQGQEDLTVSGSLWWSASNWRNRISVPLTFAVPASACDVVNSSNDVDVYGSELLVQATGQWAPHFCLNSKLFKFTHVQTGEPQAANLLKTGGAEAAFVSDPPKQGYGVSSVNAPVAVGAFSISYVIDNANGQPYTKLRLTPLLLAKLLTESYPAELPVQQEYKALSSNPLNITLDPQFQKLNPGITKGVSATEAAASLLTLSSDSDVITALTTYINDNKAARAWLNGKPDQYGMVVNPAYKEIKLPTDSWPLLSTFEPKAWYASDTNDCLKNSPQPFLPLVAAPMDNLEDISESIQFSLAASTTTCSQIDGTTTGEKLVAQGRQTTGYRFMIGVTPLADADRYQLRSAALQSTNGHTFVKPTDASMKSAVSFLKPDDATGDWPMPYNTLVTNPKAKAAYPGTMVVYASVPTTGLDATDAKDYAQLLDFAAGAGQTPGQSVGELPPGYLPMTKANGLGDLATYTRAAAQAVAAQKGATPSVTDPNPASTKTPPATKSPGNGNPTSPSSSSSGSTPPTGPTASQPPTSASTTSPPVSPPSLAPSPSAAALGKTLGIGLGGSGLVVVAIIALALVAGGGAPGTYLLGRKRGWW